MNICPVCRKEITKSRLVVVGNGVKRLHEDDHVEGLWGGPWYIKEKINAVTKRNEIPL